MMGADTSAIMAILMDEDEGPAFYAAMWNDGEVLVSTATAVELMIVAMGKQEPIYQAAVRFLERPFIRLVPLDVEQLWLATRRAPSLWQGRDRAGLNFGDTFAYALASERGLPLLYKGGDFARTDITAAV